MRIIVDTCNVSGQMLSIFWCSDIGQGMALGLGLCADDDMHAWRLQLQVADPMPCISSCP